MIGCSKKNREKLPDKYVLKKKTKPGLKYNPGLPLISLCTNAPSPKKNRSERLSTPFSEGRGTSEHRLAPGDD